MTNQLIHKITRLSDLPELKRATGKTIVAFDKNNYAIDLSLIRGKKITSITESESSDPSLPKVFTISFSDGTKALLKAYNGTTGNKGKTGDDGDKGDTGINAEIDLERSGADWQLTIINDIQTLDSEDDEHDETCNQAWSAYRGKAANVEIEARNETFMTDEEYNILFNEESISYIEAEFTSTKDGQEVLIFYNDTNPHTKYHKFWTYEDSETATYYVYNEVSGTYDPVIANLWDDIYLGDKSGFFLATNEQFNDGTELFVYDAKTGTYTKIQITDTYEEKDDEIIVYHNFETKFYDTDLQAYINVYYDYTTSKYTYSLDADYELPKDVYVIDTYTEEYVIVNYATIDKSGETTYFEKNENDEYIEIRNIEAFLEENSEDPKDIYSIRYNITYKKIDNSDIEETGFVTYFEKINDSTYVEIENISEYLKTKPDRYFVLNSNSGYDEVESIDDIDTENFQAYIKVSIDNLTNEYTFDRWQPLVKYTGTIYKETVKVYGNNGIDLYTWWEDRKYYTSEYVITQNPDGTETYSIEYHEITIPDWIFAEFTTTYEDENILVLNSIKELGEEDNSEPDTTAEDYEEEETDIIPVQFMIAGSIPVIYIKEGNTYSEVTIPNAIEDNTIFYGNDGLVINAEYWIESNELEYTPISGADVLPHHILYYKVDDVYKLYKGASVDLDATYYIVSKKYERLTPASFREHTITLFAGVPQQLPISFYPYDANNKKAVIDYDPDVITFYEGGRIASMEENGETDIIITPETGQGLHIHVILTTPMASIDVVSEDTITGDKYGLQKNPIIVGNSTTLKALVKPLTTSNKNLDYDASENIISFINKTIENNDVSVEIEGVSQGTAIIYVEANDGFGAQTSTSIEVVQPVESTQWTNIENYGPNDIHWVPDQKFTEYEAAAYNVEHGYFFGDDGYVTTDSIKEPAHYEMSILKGIEYELKIDTTPADSSKTDIEWTVVPERTVSLYKRQEPITETHEATQIDIDNNLASEIGETVTSVVGYRNYNSIKGNIVGETLVHGVNKFNSKYFDDPTDDHIKNTELDLKVVVIQSVESIDVIPQTLTFNIKDSKLLKAVVSPDSASNKNYIWESSDESVATVSETGVVTGIEPGNAVIYAKSQDGSNINGSCNVTITVPLAGISFTNGLVYVGVDNDTSVTAEIAFNTEYELDNPQLVWKSANTDIATVSGNNNIAVVHGVSLGSTTIIATDKNNSGAMGTIQINVINLVESINFDSYSNLQLNVNDMLVLIPQFNPVNASIQVLEYTSSNNSIAKVTNEGIVTAIAEGTVEITATTTDGTNKQAVCQIEIIK